MSIHVMDVDVKRRDIILAENTHCCVSYGVVLPMSVLGDIDALVAVALMVDQANRARSVTHHRQRSSFGLTTSAEPWWKGRRGFKY